MKVIIITVGTSLIQNYKNNISKELDGINPIELSKALYKYDSAETAIIKRLKIDNKREKIILISSDTKEGYLCAQAIDSYLIQTGYSYSSIIKIEGVQITDYSRLQDFGIANLINTLSKIRNDYKGNEIIIGAIGGYKVITSFATIFGVIFGIEVCYLNEDSKNLVKYPPMPVSVDREIIIENIETINKISQ